MSYSFETKLAEVEYEIKMRRQVYPGSVAARRMSQSQADLKIAIMEEIASDYRRAIERREIKRQEPTSCDTSSATAAEGSAPSSE